MFDPPSHTQVLADFGDKIVDAIRRAVASASADLTTYRQWRPLWVASHSDRGLANWIHDRLWAHLVALLDGVETVTFRDDGPIREFGVGSRYRLRAKRHTIEGFISNYPTQAALDFEMQSPTLPGLEEIRLYCGYLWEVEEREMGSAVLSLHDGRDQVVWISELLDPQGGYGSVRQLWPLDGAPTLPTITMPKRDREAKETGSDEI